MAWTDYIQPVMSMWGSMNSANARASEARKQRELEQERYNYRKQSYENMLNKSGQDYSVGETAFLNEANTQLPELQAMQNDIATQNATALNQGSAQMRSNLATSGVRGGQANTLMNRALADQSVKTQYDLNQMKFNEANQRAAERRAYQQNKAQTGQSAGYQLPSF